MSIPLKLQSVLIKKIIEQKYDSVEYFGVVQDEDSHYRSCICTLENGLEVEENIFLIDRVLSFPFEDINQLRKLLQNSPQLKERLRLIFGISDNSDDDFEYCTVEDCIIYQFYKYLHFYVANNEVWVYIMDEIGSAVNCSVDSEPNMKYESIEFNDTQYTVCYPIKKISHGDVLTRDYFSDCAVSAAIRNCFLCEWIPDGITPCACRNLMDNHSLFLKSLKASAIESVSATDVLIPTSSIPSYTGSYVYKVYTDPSDPCGLLHPTSGLSNHPRFTMVKNRDDADILWFTTPNTDKSLWSVGSAASTNSPDTLQTVCFPMQHPEKPQKPFINQFPYEGAFVSKDHLCNQIRRTLGAPIWAVTSYDMEQQSSIELFVGDYLTRLAAQKVKYGTEVEFKRFVEGLYRSSPPAPCESEAEENNIWILKPRGGAHSKGHIITNSLIRILRYVQADPKRIVQKYIERPLLYKDDRKFDMRFVVMLRQCNPVELFVYNVFWTRVAGKPHVGSAKSQHSDVSKDRQDSFYSQLEDVQSVFTAMQLVQKRENPNSNDLREIFPDYQEVIRTLEQLYGVNWKDIETRIHSMLLELFTGVSMGQPNGMKCDNSRAVYGCDVMLEHTYDDEGKCLHIQPKLLEVSFCPANNNLDPAYTTNYPDYTSDIFDCLFLNRVSQNITQLHP